MIKSQSAMEYLMTYGWAILIIAVVLAALFELGVFNPITFAPKASPGSCQVVRPEGAGTTNFISLEGECNGELPQYVASFNGASGLVSTPTKGFSGGAAVQFTLSAWIYQNNVNTRHYILGYGSDLSNSQILMSTNEFSAGQFSLETCGNGWTSDATLLPNVWYNLVISYNGVGNPSFYVNGVNYGVADTWGSPAISPVDSNGIIGNGEPCNPSIYMNGYIADAEVYNISLSANDINALYKEGIGGAPIKIQNLVGWWPLNGNANDYSGNGNNGVPSGVTYTSNWYSGYSTP